MNILINEKKKITFDDVKPGDLFAVGEKNELYLRISETTTIIRKKKIPWDYITCVDYVEDYAKVNAISVRTGELAYCDKSKLDPIKLVESIQVNLKEAE